ncbi:MAG: T9SS type A sorting domain-containing protein [Bacteroidota bacterium]
MRLFAKILSLWTCLVFLCGVSVAQLNGTYYIGAAGTRPGGGDPEYATLKAAVDALTASGVSGPVTLYFTESKTYTEPENVALLPTGTSATNTITFKPYTGVTATVSFTKTTDNTGLSGGWIIGAKDVTTTSATNYGITVSDSASYITIDGSNTNGGTTRDLTVQTQSTTNVNTNPFRIFGNVNNITLKNVVITAYQSVSYAVNITPRFSTINYIPDNITVENCAITNIAGSAAQGIGVSQSGTVTVFPTGYVFRDNYIRARTRGVFMNGGGSADIYRNKIIVIQSGTGSLSEGVYALLVGTSSTLNIYSNTFDTLSTAQGSTAGTFGVVGILCESNATYNVYNNMITNILTTTATVDPNLARVSGIHIAAGTAYVYHNTINMNDLAYDPTGSTRLQVYAGIRMSSGTVTAKNNIVVCSEANDSSYAIYRSGGTLTSDRNDLYQVSGAGYVGFYTSAQPALSDWQSASSQDANSKSVSVTFAGATDLHLTAGSDGDLNLIGAAGTGVATDIDGDTRNAFVPYMGADEAATVLPVQLTSFTATASRLSAKLQWSTASEVNNYGFDVERRSLGSSSWTKVGFVAGAGASSAARQYSYIDQAPAGRYAYRLKQINADGSFQYYGNAEVELGLMPKELSLNPNYPNPFNPSTTVEFVVPENGHASLKVYDIVGREVTTLFEGNAEAGRLYRSTFNASHLASGTYISVLHYGSQRVVRKMLLTK